MFKYIVLFAALFLATISAWFSVSGISQLFIGSLIPAMIMAIALEFGKVVGISFLYRYWEILAKPIKSYMIFGGVVLMLITSVGVYGYLSSAYSKAATDYLKLSATTQQIQTEITSNQTQIDQYNIRIQQLMSNRDQQESRLNQLVGKPGFITQQRMAKEAESDLKNAQSELNKLFEKKSNLQSQMVESQNSMNSNAKLSSFNYFAKTLNVPLDVIVKWFILIIVCVFDPMSIALMLGYNTLVKHETNQAKDGLWVEPPISKPRISNTPNAMPDAKNSVLNDKIDSKGTPWIAPEPKGESVI